ncbi:MAG TPA: YfiR family protein [Lacunisphaera sp.]|nr:YfiR family protein [Lacunisphaera sp.]
MAILSFILSWLPAHARKHPFRRWHVLGAAALLLSAPLAPAATAPSREYQIKAVFLFNFARFVEWPEDAFPDAAAPLIIGVLGEDPFGSVLDETVGGDQAGARPLQVRRWQRVEDVDTCHILFITKSQAANVESIFTHLKGRSVLTVSDADGPTRHGPMIRLVNENNRIRLKINLEAARAARLVISSKLLRPAIIVSDKGGDT